MPHIARLRESWSKAMPGRQAVPTHTDGPDLKDPDLYLDERCHVVFSWLREDRPAYWNPEADGTGFWAITRYDDVLRVLKDPNTFSSAMERGGIRIFNIRDVNGPQAKPHLLSLDGPAHARIRQALMPFFSSERIARMEPGIRRRLATLIDRVAHLGRAEFVTSIAAPLTLGTLAEFMDLPDRDLDKFLRWSNTMIGDDDRDYGSSAERSQCVSELDVYAAQLFAQCRASSKHGFLSVLASGDVHSAAPDVETFSTNFAMFLIAGNETTRHSISAGMLAISQYGPAQRSQLLADPALMESTVKEIIRLATPLIHVRRTATRDVEIGGQLIRAGDKVVVWYIAANRDEEKWTNAAQFDGQRFLSAEATPHLAFGAGPHHCLGRRLGEMQLQIALEELLRRLPDIQVAGGVRRLRSNFIAGIKEMQVTFTPQPRE